MRNHYLGAAIVCEVLASAAMVHGDWKASAIFFADAAIFCIARQLCTTIHLGVERQVTISELP